MTPPMTATPNRSAGPERPGAFPSAPGGSSRRRAGLLLPLAATVWAFACDDGPKPPAACAAIAPQTTYVGVKTLVFPCFEDPEMGELALDAVSSDPGVVTSEVLGNDKVRIVGVSPGTAAITVTATDPDGMAGELVFEARVPNRPPRLREDDDGDDVEIPAFRLAVGGPAAVVVLSDHFLDPDGQELAYGATSSDPAVVSVALSADTLAVSGLSPGTATVSVTATDPGGLSDTVRVEALALRRPGPPTNLVAALWNNSADSVVVTWTAPADTGGTAMTGYRVEWRHESHDPERWTVVRNTAATEARFTFSLNLGGYNHFRARAVNALGPGDPSNVDRVFVVIPNVPEPPSLTARKSPSGYRLHLEWEPSPNDTATITRWAIERSLNGGDWDTYLTPPPNRRTQEFGWGFGVDSLRYRIAARYGTRGQGVWSNVARATWEGPDRPTGLAAAAEGDSAVVLTWKAPEDTGLPGPDSPVTGYMIETSSDGGRNWRHLAANTGTPATTYRHDFPARGTTHLYVVSAITGVGIGPPSTVASATTAMDIDAPAPLTPVRLANPGSNR